jgi:hypothetical protein
MIAKPSNHPPPNACKTNVGLQYATASPLHTFHNQRNLFSVQFSFRAFILLQIERLWNVVEHIQHILWERKKMQIKYIQIGMRDATMTSRTILIYIYLRIMYAGNYVSCNRLCSCPVAGDSFRPSTHFCISSIQYTSPDASKVCNVLGMAWEKNGVLYKFMERSRSMGI